MYTHPKLDKAVTKQRESTTRLGRNSFFSRRTVVKGILGFGALVATGGIEAITKTDIFNPKTALADFSYDGAKAAQWADEYAISSGTNYTSITQGGVNLEPSWWEQLAGSAGTDCTCFVSNALLQGGFAPDNQWYCNDSNHDGDNGYHPWSVEFGVGTNTQQLNNNSSNGFGYHPWTVPGDLFYYMQSTGYGYVVSKFVGPQWGTNNTNGLAQGDLVFFSWKNDENIDHMAIQTTGLLDSNGYSTDHVDAHSSDRSSVFWTLEDFWQNDGDIPDRNNVAIYVMHISSNTATALYVPSY